MQFASSSRSLTFYLGYHLCKFAVVFTLWLGIDNVKNHYESIQTQKIHLMPDFYNTCNSPPYVIDKESLQPFVSTSASGIFGQVHVLEIISAALLTDKLQCPYYSQGT